MAYLPSIGAVQDAVARVVAAALEGVPVDVGYPPGGPQADHVWVSGDADCRYQELDSVPAHRTEHGTVRVHVLCTRIARTLDVARDECLSLAARVEQAIAADLTLGGAVDWSRVESVEGKEGAADERTRQYGVTLTVAYSRYQSREA